MPTATRHRNHTAHACPADHVSRRRPTPKEDLPWEMHIGFVKLSIIGPEDHLWFACSDAVYGAAPVGTDKERDRARRAVAFLNKNHPTGEGVTRAVIDSILAQVSTHQ